MKENRLRRMADRQGLRLSKSRTRDPNGMDFGLYALIDTETNGLVHAALANRWAHALTLDEAEDWLTDRPNPFGIGDRVKLVKGTTTWGQYHHLADKVGTVVAIVRDGTSLHRISVTFNGDLAFQGAYASLFEPA